MFLKKLSVLVLFATMSVSGFAGDLDDGISLDKPINDDLQLDMNIDFIKRNAKAKAKRRTPGDKSTLTSGSGPNGCDGAGNIKIGPATDLKGVKQIINISTNKGVSTICSH